MSAFAWPVRLLVLVLLVASQLPMPALPQPIPSPPANATSLADAPTIPASAAASLVNHSLLASPLNNATATSVEQLSVPTDGHTEFAYRQQRRSPITRAIWFIVLVTVIPFFCCCCLLYAVYQLCCGGYYTSDGGGMGIF